MDDNKYTIGTGSIGGDDFDPDAVTDDATQGAPTPVDGLDMRMDFSQDQQYPPKSDQTLNEQVKDQSLTVKDSNIVEGTSDTKSVIPPKRSGGSSSKQKMSQGPSFLTAKGNPQFLTSKTDSSNPQFLTKGGQVGTTKSQSYDYSSSDNFSQDTKEQITNPEPTQQTPVNSSGGIYNSVDAITALYPDIKFDPKSQNEQDMYPKEATPDNSETKPEDLQYDNIGSFALDDLNPQTKTEDITKVETPVQDSLVNLSPEYIVQDQGYNYPNLGYNTNIPGQYPQINNQYPTYSNASNRSFPIKLIIGFLFLLGIVGIVVVGFSYYKSKYQQKISIEAKRADFQEIEEELNNFNNNVTDYYGFIDQETSDSETNFDKEYWEKVKTEGDEILSEKITIEKLLDEYSSANPSVGNVDTVKEFELLKNYLTTATEYINAHKLVSDIMIDLEEEIDTLEDEIENENWENAKSMNENLKLKIENSRNTFSTEIYNTTYLEKYSLLSYYYDYLEYLGGVQKEIETAISNKELEIVNTKIQYMKGIYKKEIRVEAERSFYADFINLKQYKDRESITQEINNALQNQIDSYNIPKIIYNLFEKLDKDINLF